MFHLKRRLVRSVAGVLFGDVLPDSMQFGIGGVAVKSI